MNARRLSPVLSLLALLVSACGEQEAAPPAGQAAAPAPSAGAARDTGGQAAAPPKAADKAADKAAATKAPPPAERGEKMAPAPATVLRETELKDKPFIDARTLKRLPARTALTIVDRDGGWLKVMSDGQQGWVRLLHVSSQPPGSRADTAQELEAVAKIATGRAGSGNIVSTTGIRGLSEEQLREAKPAPEEVRRLEGYGVGKEQAAEYARAHGLERRQLAQLPEPR